MVLDTKQYKFSGLSTRLIKYLRTKVYYELTAPITHSGQKLSLVLYAQFSEIKHKLNMDLLKEMEDHELVDENHELTRRGYDLILEIAETS